MNQFKSPKPGVAIDGHMEKHGTSERQADVMGSAEDAVQRAIGSQLRAVYEEVVSLPVPDKFLALLSSLDSKTATTPGCGRDSES